MSLQNTLALDTKYATISGVRDINAPDEVEVHKVIKSFNIGVDNSTIAGTQTFALPLDARIDQIAAEIALGFEYYSIDEATVTLNSSSPLGTTSGALQFGHIHDPYNAYFGDDKGTSLKKAVRQYGSVMVRPRESVKMQINCPGRRYTVDSADLRFSSFGLLFGIVRVAPELGDSFSLQCTVEFTYKFSRMTIQRPQSSSAVTRANVSFDLPAKSCSRPMISLPKRVMRQRSCIKLYKPVMISYKKEGNSKLMMIEELQLSLNGQGQHQHDILFSRLEPENVTFLNVKAIRGEWIYSDLQVERAQPFELE